MVRPVSEGQGGHCIVVSNGEDTRETVCVMLRISQELLCVFRGLVNVAQWRKRSHSAGLAVSDRLTAQKRVSSESPLRLFMLQNIHQPPERVTHEKTADTPRFGNGAVFGRETRALHACQ